MKNRKGAANAKRRVPPEKLEPDAQGASGNNVGYVKENHTTHLQNIQVGEAI